MNLYATALAGAAAADWRCTGIDPEGLDLQAGKIAVRLDFPARVTTGQGLRDMLKRMADLARKSAAS
jgi:hypothetical protein